MLLKERGNYDPAVGRGYNPDGPKGGLNTFGYVGGRPNKFIDPLGLRTEQQVNPASPIC